MHFVCVSQGVRERIAYVPCQWKLRSTILVIPVRNHVSLHVSRRDSLSARTFTGSFRWQGIILPIIICTSATSTSGYICYQELPSGALPQAGIVVSRNSILQDCFSDIDVDTFEDT